MPRPRTHDLEQLMDAAEGLAVRAGPAAVTVRALSELTSMSNGAIYHAFGSRAGLVGRVWLRAAEQFLAAQREAVDAVLTGGDGRSDSAVEAVVVAADAPARFLLEAPVRGGFLLTVDRGELLGSDDLPDDLARELRGLDRSLTSLFVELSQAVWQRADRDAVSVIRDCVVELPTALLLRGRRTPDAATRERIATAVRAVLSLTPTEPSHQSTSSRKDPS
ncbi:helix-turn-helix domain-containing protein [Gordonia sp. WA4-43]|uniref:helix-turn-helix domain-containing protein n=1 Tax=Gordonia sp. WA4-43 TaxID=2878678 RepID=UPI001CFB169A|nr:helix-turn-helix domain-containing protein [Gordonia sp. WA4-43]UCZ92227.1 TetR/AcrR family transcriptional regulator [Gordonia sp. WA4-43]